MPLGPEATKDDPDPEEDPNDLPWPALLAPARSGSSGDAIVAPPPPSEHRALALLDSPPTGAPMGAIRLDVAVQAPPPRPLLQPFLHPEHLRNLLH
jgi:hypothetical protein